CPRHESREHMIVRHRAIQRCEAAILVDHCSNTESSPAGQLAAPSLSAKQQRSGARAVGSYVPRLTQKAMQKFGFSTAALLTAWPAIVGQDLAHHTSPQRLKWPRAPEARRGNDAEGRRRLGATLHLSVDASRALEVEYKGRQIVERINSYFGYCAVA